MGNLRLAGGTALRNAAITVGNRPGKRLLDIPKQLQGHGPDKGDVFRRELLYSPAEVRFASEYVDTDRGLNLSV